VGGNVAQMAVSRYKYKTSAENQQHLKKKHK
jgi:hypothetical protein